MMNRNRLLDRLLDSARTLHDAIESCPTDLSLVRPAGGGFAIVEHAWHLCDFEEEGIAVRLRRTITEVDPQLADFRGDEIAESRRYIDRVVAPAPQRFVNARRANVDLLVSATDPDWLRTAVQEKVGAVTLETLAEAILRHDIAHANEIVPLLRELRLRVPEALISLAGLEPFAKSA